MERTSSSELRHPEWLARFSKRLESLYHRFYGRPEKYRKRQKKRGTMPVPIV
jgi:hypothetical protein